ncbi:pseudouridine synthase [Rivibacter subsaxonicus]|uniref:Dual-specificity RNA pseudouridine synthase RluF n=1 Tax=Rivibacter subsaxonicus TaxID=457575 RepID=A0A4Q7W1N4_9BURK|nr:pseudouridine synthase [Rivibacter subsaxonicus]RZU03157.1 23S rRNA pseudouridine2604 synthase [Rivibacter subsaxonicus]
MATIKLPPKKNAPAARDDPAGPRRAPVRGKNAHRERTTLAEAQAQRAAHQPQQQHQQRPPVDRRDERPAPPRGASPSPRRAPVRDVGPPSGFGNSGFGPFEPRDSRPQVRSAPPLERGPSRPSQQRGPTPPRPAAPARIPPEALKLRALLHDDEDVGPARGGKPHQPHRAEHGAELPRLSKRMSELGLASRREADEWIAAGWVRVDGVVVDQLGARVRPDQKVEVDPIASQQQAQRVTILINKPIGWVSGQPEDGYESAASLIRAETHWAGDGSGLRFHPGQLRGLAPAGRLDIDSTGLLVLTQDGRVAKQLIGADSDVEKEYLVRVSWLAHPDVMNLMHTVPAEMLAQLRHGLVLDGEALKPARVSWQNEQQLRFVLREGKKRQIRRMCELVGLKVIGLRRVRIGRIVLGDLPLGQWRYLTGWEKF